MPLSRSGAVERRQVDRRRRRGCFAWPERRSGFDRRGPARGAGRMTVGVERILTALRDRPAVLRVVLILINILNVTDYLLTRSALAAGAQEANPIMRSLFARDPFLAGAFKFAAILAVSLVIWRFRRFRSVLGIALIVLAVFLGVFLYHIVAGAVFG